MSCSKPNEVVTSPDGNLQVEFKLKQGIPYYNIQKAQQPLLLDSKMGFQLIDQDDLTGNFKIVAVERDSKNQTWEQPWGEFKEVVDNHSELTIKLQEESGANRLMNIVFRVFNDGVGFRYEFPKQEQLDSVMIADETTEFTFAKEHDVWWMPVHSENSYYESYYRKNKIGETDTINTPATFETNDGTFFAIHEANLTDFASMTLRQTTEKQYISELVPWSNGVKVYAQTPFTSPWRTVIIGDNPGDVATATITLNLNEPCVLEDVSWIEPSKYIGIWWGMHLEKYTWGQGPKHGATTENTKRYIDFANENGFDGVLVEGWNYGWDGDWASNGENFSFTKAYPDFDLEEVCRYAASKNVRLIGHHETAGAVSNYEAQMEDAFKLYHKNGVNAVKTGYVNKYLDGKEWHDSQFGVRHYRKVIETAARYQIMIDNHEPVKGTGLQRTYPNLMTQEGARGQEYDAWSADGGNTPEHTTIMPFTRMLAGPFDFTPGTFDFDYQTPNNAKVQTTLAKQLAMYVIIFSPQQMASDLPENYIGKPAFEFVKQVPAIWSNTKVLDAVIGDYVITARKDWDSEDWYVGAISDENERQLSVDLSFLDEAKQYTAEIYRDGKGADYKTNPYPIIIENKQVDNTGKLKINLAKGGGVAIRLSPLQQ
ncbi:glycoside hydrolase family 97 protein [Carboxylicivirga sp. A043]|nr:glycoside hydrolase family 97 protein [Carboxylicivirga sp. A043]